MVPEAKNTNLTLPSNWIYILAICYYETPNNTLQVILEIDMLDGFPPWQIDLEM